MLRGPHEGWTIVDDGPLVPQLGAASAATTRRTPPSRPTCSEQRDGSQVDADLPSTWLAPRRAPRRTPGGRGSCTNGRFAGQGTGGAEAPRFCGPSGVAGGGGTVHGSDRQGRRGTGNRVGSDSSQTLRAGSAHVLGVRTREGRGASALPVDGMVNAIRWLVCASRQAGSRIVLGVFRLAADNLA